MQYLVKYHFNLPPPRIPSCAQEHAGGSWSAGLGSGAESTNPGTVWLLQAHHASVRVQLSLL